MNPAMLATTPFLSGQLRRRMADFFILMLRPDAGYKKALQFGRSEVSARASRTLHRGVREHRTFRETPNQHLSPTRGLPAQYQDKVRRLRPGNCYIARERG